MGWQDEIGPKTSDFLKEFGLNFLKSYGVCMFLKMKADFEAEQASAAVDTRKLKYRGWNSVEPKALKEGGCWMKDGAGEGSFGGWSGCYLVQLPDGNLAVFRDAKAAVGKDPKKAKLVIKTAGYKLVREVTAHYDHQAWVACRELACEKPDVGYSQYAWAMTHGVRQNFIFQLHKGAGGGCACFGGAKVEPAEAGFENAAQAEEWAAVCEQCAASSSPRKLTTSVIAMAFERTVKKMSLSLPELKGFSDDGTEGQILSHMAFLAVFEASCKAEVQEQLQKAPFGHLALWFKARGTAADVVEKAVDKAWAQLQTQAEEQSVKLEAKIKPLVEAILKKKAELQEMLRTQVGERIGSALSKLLAPILKPLTSALGAPLAAGVVAVMTVYQKEMDARFGDKSISGELPADVKSSLDQVPRDPSRQQALELAAAALVTPLAEAKRAAGEEALTGLDPAGVKVKYCKCILQLLDAMIFTTEEDLKTTGRDTSAAKADVLARAKADAVDMQRQFVRQFFVDLLMGELKQRTKEFVDPAIESAQSLIPEDLSEIIDLDAEYNTLLEITIAAAIGKAFEPK